MTDARSGSTGSGTSIPGDGRVVRFGEFELDVAAPELRRGTELVEIGATPLRVLVALVEQAGRFVSKERLLEAGWPGVTVSDASLHSALRQVRRALGDDGREQRWIETRKGRGYRFRAALDADPDGPTRGPAAGAVEPMALWNRVRRRAGGDPRMIDALLRTIEREGARGLDAAFRAELVRLPADLLAEAAGVAGELPEALRPVLASASVLGADFSRDEIDDLAPGSTGELVQSIEHGWLEAVPGRPLRLRFSSAWVREHLYASLRQEERERLHRAAARRLIERGEDRPEDASRAAFHWLKSGATAIEAIGPCERAAHGFAKQRDLEEAVVHHLAALAVADAIDWHQRHRLWMQLGNALFRLGDQQGARDAHLRAAALAREHDDPEALAKAALGHAGADANVETSRFLPDRADLLGEALGHSARLDARSNARLEARLARELSWDGRLDEASARAGRALQLLRANDGDPGEAYGILRDAYWAIWSPDNTDERIEVAREMHERARVSQDPQSEALAGALLGSTLLENGDRAGAEAAYAGRGGTASRGHAGFRLGAQTLRACLALLDGRFADAERWIGETHALRRELRAQNADAIFAAQMGWLRLDQGRLSEFAPALLARLDRPREPALRAGRALLLAHGGRRTEAGSELQALVEKLADLPRGPFWLTTLVTLTETAVELADVESARALLPALAPHASRCVVIGIHTACRGSVALYLGLAAQTAGEPGRSIPCFEQAIRMHARLGAAPLLARSQVELASALADQPEATRAGREALAEALRIRDQLGLSNEEPKIAELRERLA